MRLRGVQPNLVEGLVHFKPIHFCRTLVTGRPPIDQCQTQGGVAGTDQVTMVKNRRPNAIPVDVGAIPAPHIDQPALRRIHFDHEMDAGNTSIIIDKLEMGYAGTTDHKIFAPVEFEPAAFVGSFDNLQCDWHN